MTMPMSFRLSADDFKTDTGYSYETVRRLRDTAGKMQDGEVMLMRTSQVPTDTPHEQAYSKSELLDWAESLEEDINDKVSDIDW